MVQSVTELKVRVDSLLGLESLPNLDNPEFGAALLDRLDKLIYELNRLNRNAEDGKFFQWGD